MRTKVLLAIFILSMVLPGPAFAGFDENSKEFQNVIKQLDMQGHADDELSSCKVKQIYYEEVVEMLNSGMSEAEILQSYVDEYGQAALRTPATDKSGLVAWGMPFAGLAAGVAIVALWLRRGKARGGKEEGMLSAKWESQTEKEIAEKMFEEERRKHF
ncbi:cytochrome c-type biogenesis protein CcmH [Bacillus sp. FJAT-27251]|uniref:cytochrome c-type biogenesis protein CcmH n=1 Tax=Bacillus sp. FJAT-27251 TaxID=1684142 RepID=UPI0006A7D25D|nr:cytochrome c-type biogenesis protein CcmH [Bacillus sp. FJAT-27251]